ncbi:MAG: glycosyl hydrolase [Nibricoccus sp.]
MISRLLRISPFIVAALSLSATEPSPWPTPTAEMKPWTRWWWPASAVDKENLTRELTEFSQAGLGGVEITPIYGAKGFESRFIPFLSPKYVEMLAFTGSEAHRLGLKVDMATGTGWPFGGPQVTPADAELQIEVKDGKLVASPTNFKVKRAAPGGSGLVVNPYSTAALGNYLKPFDAAFANLPKGTINSQFHDSFEYKANWSPEFEAKFREMHGYDLRDHPAEFGGQGEPDTIARIKSDYRETLNALHLDYVRAWVDWAHKNGQTARNQAHGAPANLLDLYALSDIPETEIFGSLEYPIPGFRSTPDELSYNKPQPLIARFASSAAHVTGKKLVSSETFTWLRQHFHEAPSQMKPELDQLFLAGINHVFYHGTCYSPSDAQWPGWLFYASTQYNDRNALWRDLGEGLNAYITRCQSLLQQGEPDTDVLVYWPIYDLWHNAEGTDMRFGMHDAKWITETPAGKLAQKLIDAGIQFDFISDAQLQACTISPEDGFRTTSGQVHGIILVPKTNLMPEETLQHLRLLAEKRAARIIFIDSFPLSVPGLNNLSQRRADFNKQIELLKNLPPLKPAPNVSVILPPPNAQVCDTDTLLRELKALREPMVSSGLGFIRRKLADHSIVYFVTNSTAQPFDGWLPLRRPRDGRLSNVSLLLNPQTGTFGIAQTKLRDTEANDEMPHVYLQLAAGESVLIRPHTHEDLPSAPSKYFTSFAKATALTSPWSITFLRGGPELPPPYKAAELKSWTEQGGEAERFAGTARYETEFEVPAGVTADEWQLDLGDVRETARVFVNGKQVDLLWSLPFRTKIGAFLKPGKNTLAIEVTNLSANRIRDLDKRGVVWKNFYEINFVNPHYEKLDASKWPIMPSGLLGPVTLTPLKKFDPATEK